MSNHPVVYLMDLILFCSDCSFIKSLSLIKKLSTVPAGLPRVRGWDKTIFLTCSFVMCLHLKFCLSCLLHQQLHLPLPNVPTLPGHTCLPSLRLRVPVKHQESHSPDSCTLARWMCLVRVRVCVL